MISLAKQYRHSQSEFKWRVKDKSDNTLRVLLEQEARLFGSRMADDKRLLVIAEEIHQRDLVNSSYRRLKEDQLTRKALQAATAKEEAYLK